MPFLLYMSSWLCTITVIWSVTTESIYSRFSYIIRGKALKKNGFCWVPLIQVRALEKWEDAFLSLWSTVRYHLFPFVPLPSPSGMACKVSLMLLVVQKSCCCQLYVHKRKCERCFHYGLACVPHQEIRANSCPGIQAFLFEVGCR